MINHECPYITHNEKGERKMKVVSGGERASDVLMLLDYEVAGSEDVKM